MTKDEIEFVKKEIERMGFPLEMEISSILKEDGWEVFYSSPYFDEDEEKWREIDIKAYKSIGNESHGKSIKPYCLSIALVIECKKSELSSWAFFPQPRDAEEIERATNMKFLDFLTVIKRQSLLKHELGQTRILPLASSLRMLNIDPSLVDTDGLVTPDVARNIRFISEFGIITPRDFRQLVSTMKAVTYGEINLGKGKKKSPLSEIFEAINMLIKAVKHELRLASTGIQAGASLFKRESEILSSEGKLLIDIILPILTFDGRLYSWLKGNVERKNEMLLEGRCHSQHYFENMLISVVTKDHFRDLLTEVNNGLARLADRIYENRERLDEEVKKIMESQWFKGVSMF